MICEFCRRQLVPGLVYFCRPCFFDLPAKERIALVTMHGRRLDVGSKVQKCVRILAEKRAAKIPPLPPTPEPEPYIPL